MKRILPLLAALLFLLPSLAQASYAPLSTIPGCTASYNAANLTNTTTTASWSSGNPVISVANTSGFVAGELISASNATFPANATILSIVTNTSITISANPTGNGSAINITGTGAIVNTANPGTADGFVYGPSGWNTSESVATTIPYMPAYTGSDGQGASANTQTCNNMQITEASATQKQSVKLPITTTGSAGWTLIWVLNDNSGAGNSYILSDATTTANFNIQIGNPYNVESNAGGTNAIVSTGSNLKQNQGTLKQLVVTFNPTGNIITISWDGVQRWSGAMNGAVSVNGFLMGTTTAAAGGRLCNLNWTIFNVYNRVLSWEEIRAERENIAQATLPSGLTCVAWFGNSHLYGFGASNARTTSFRAMAKAYLTNGATTTTATWSSSATTLTVPTTTGFVPGESISAANGTIPANTMITSVVGTTVGISQATTGTGSSANVTATGKGLPLVWVEDCVVGRPTQTMLTGFNAVGNSNRFPLCAAYIILWSEDTNQNAAIDSISPYSFTGTLLEAWINDWSRQSMLEYWPYVKGVIIMNTLPRANADEPNYRTAVTSDRASFLATLQGNDKAHTYYVRIIDPGVDQKLAYAGISGAANTISITGFFTSGSPNVSSLVVNTPNGSISDVKATQVLALTGTIATNATISSINTGAATLVMSANALQGGTKTFTAAQLSADQFYASDGVHENDPGNLYTLLTYIEPTLLIAVAPATPGTLTLGTVGSTSVTGNTWTAAGSGPTGNTLTAQLQVSRQRTGDWQNVSGATSSPSDITGILAGTKYSARVRYADAADPNNYVYSPVVHFTTTGSPADTSAPTVTSSVVDATGRWITFTFSKAVAGQKGFHVFVNGTEWPNGNAGRGSETTVVLYFPHTILASSVHTVTWTYLTSGGDGNIIDCTTDATAMAAVTTPQSITTNNSDNTVASLVVRASTAGGVGGTVSATAFSVEADNGSSTLSHVLTQGDMVMTALYGTFNTTSTNTTGPVVGGIPAAFLTPPVYVPSWNGLGSVQITATSWLDPTKIIIFPYAIQSVPRPTPAKRIQTRLTGVGSGRPTR